MCDYLQAEGVRLHEEMTVGENEDLRWVFSGKALECFQI